MSFGHDRQTGSERVPTSGAGAGTAQTVAALAKVRLPPTPCDWMSDVCAHLPRSSLLPRTANHCTMTDTATYS